MLQQAVEGLRELGAKNSSTPDGHDSAVITARSGSPVFSLVRRSPATRLPCFCGAATGKDLADSG